MAIRMQAQPYINKAVAALRRGEDVLVRCQSGLARSNFVAMCVRAQGVPGVTYDLNGGESSESYVRQKRPLWKVE